ncbi:DUF3500 domain-containing protein [Brevibacterium sp. 5221]|uniref:DUF3500 domain-containing protein n=1 Tax=Brevibacterium rongguiense TaxID=2695267 RepID=A0A6N9H9C2_9MICO|nr:DUF3500 domain-containing protein [Brevibacterium rongguiense]MYM20648.1 DUF3500 domain-containing protein [Brevibacterium rongguiense]
MVQPPAPYRQFLFSPGHPRIEELKGLDAYEYREVARRPGTFTGGLVEGWTPHYLEDFTGVTSDGALVEGLYPLEPARAGEEAPVAAMVAAARTLLEIADDDQRARLQHAVDASEWQTWANPEFMQFDTGVRLEFASPEFRTAALALVQASLSPQGWELTRNMMRINGFLGEVVGLPNILGDYSYNIALYGKPDERQPWGWQLFGHHCAVNCLVVEGRMTVGPVFHGAEPNEIDAGSEAGLRTFDDRVDAGTDVMARLTAQERDAAVLYANMVDPAMPEGRVHPGDERHLAGAFQDNRVIPYEGLALADASEDVRAAVMRLVETFLVVLPEGPRAAKRREVAEHLGQSWFCWIGGTQPGDVFYYRFQSPVLIAELDHHCGVFLDYDVPQRFHVHTVMRTPNGNDYGRAWVRQWQAAHG